ncbi:hypothetical protein [Spirosoma fluminis]
MKKNTKISPVRYEYLLTRLIEEIDKTPKIEPDRQQWDIEGNWQDCGDINFVDSQYMSNFALWRGFACKTIKLINYNKPAVRMSFFSKHKYWLKKPHDLTDEDRLDYLTEHISNLYASIHKLQEFSATASPLGLAEMIQRIDTMRQEIEQWQLIRQQPANYDLSVSTYQRGYAYLYINYKFMLPNGDYDNEQEHLLHHTRDRLGNVTKQKQNIVFVNMAEINRVHPQQNKEIENYLKKFSIKSSFGPKWLYARPRVEADEQASFGLNNPANDITQLDLFSE